MKREMMRRHVAKCHGYSTQGDWLSFDAVMGADLGWKALIYSVPQQLLKLLLNSAHNILPTTDILRRWGETSGY